MVNTVLVTEPNGEIKAREFSHMESFASLKLVIPWPVYNPRKEMVFFSPVTGKLSVTNRQQVQVAR